MDGYNGASQGDAPTPPPPPGGGGGSNFHASVAIYKQQKPPTFITSGAIVLSIYHLPIVIQAFTAARVLLLILCLARIVCLSIPAFTSV